MKRIFGLFALTMLSCALLQAQHTTRTYHLSDLFRSTWLGVMIQDVDRDLAKEMGLRVDAGALITEVMDDSPAEAAGLLKDDVIVKFDNRSIEDADDLTRAVRRADPGDRVEIVVDRKGDRKTLTAELEKQRASKSFAFTIPETPSIAPLPRGMGFYLRGSIEGLEVQDLGRQLAEYFEVPGNRGILVTSVKKNSAAGKAGIRAGDIIISVNGNRVLDTDDMIGELREAGGKEVPVELVRKGKSLTVKVAVEAGEDLSFYLNRGTYRFDHEPLLEYEDRLELRRELMDELKAKLRELRDELREGAAKVRNAIEKELKNL